jgi:endonuclease YncB( thermonuclease family)
MQKLLAGLLLFVTIAEAHAVPAIVEGKATVTDGDTVTVTVEGDKKGEKKSYEIRLKGVDAPESWMKGGPAATAAMQEIVGDWLRCELTGEKTRKREVGFCRNREGKDIAAEVIKKSLALCCPHYSKRYCEFEQPVAVQNLARARYCLER